MSRKVGRIIAILIIITILSILAVIFQHESVTYAAGNVGVQYKDRIQEIDRVYLRTTIITTVIDTETGVCYLCNESSGVTPLLNQDGTPFVANGWRDDG